MLYRGHQPLSTVMKILGLILLIISSAGAEDTRDMEGWGSDDPYNKHYDVRKFEKLRAWAEINGRDVFMGSNIKKRDYWELKVRLTKSGRPSWTMTPDELARERAQN